MQQTAFASLLLGAGAGLVAAHPAWPGFFPHYHHHHSLSGSAPASFSYPIVPTGLSLSSGLVKPTGYALPTGTGFSIGTGFPFPTGSGFPSLPTGFPTGTYPSASAASISLASSVSIDAIAASSTSVALVKESANETSTAAAASSTSATVSESSVDASSSCTFTDAASAISGKTGCTSIVLSGIAVPAGTTLDMSDLSDGTTVTFEGTTTFGYEEWDGPLIEFSGTDITVQGASGHEINMDGQNWWDGQGSNGGKTKPKGFYAHSLTDSTITGLNIKNTPIQCFSIDGASNLKIVDVTIDNSAGDGTDGGHNTDAFDVGDSTGVYISGANVKNQDDCLAINSGSDISFTGGTCSGGHGLSIGSVGGRSDNDVSNIYIADSTISDSENGVRIKTVSGATGSVKNVTYSGITLSGITSYGIVIEQDYENGDPTGTPTSGVPITDLTLKDITGSVSSDADTYYILCAACSDWTVSGVDVTGGSASSKCEGEPSGVSLC